MSAIPPKADVSRACRDVCFVPKADKVHRSKKLPLNELVFPAVKQECQSNAEMPFQYLRVGLYFAGWAFVHDVSVVNNVGPLCKRKRCGEILLH